MVMIIFAMLARKEAHAINALSNNIQTIIEKKDSIIPDNKFAKYICWCLDSFNCLILTAFLGTAKYMVSIVSSTPIKEDAAETINDILSLLSRKIAVLLFPAKHIKKINIGKMKFE